MSSIPLPALHAGVNTEQPDLLSQFAKIQQLKAMQQEGALRQQQVQQGNIDLHDSEVLSKAYMDAEGDLDKTAMIAAKQGVSPRAMMNLRQAAIQQKTETLKLVNEQGVKALHDADLTQGAYDQLKAAPPEQRAALYPQLLQGLQAAQVDVSQYPQEYPGDDKLPFLGAVIKSHKTMLDDAAKQAGISKDQAQLAESQARLPGIQADTQQKQRVLAGTSPTGITANQQAELDIQQQRANQANRNENEGTWQLAEDPQGNSVMFNSKTKQVAPANGVVPKGTAANKQKDYEKNIAGPKAAQDYAENYLNNGVFTGPGDEALQEKFFELAKPSTGFRMTQPQMAMLAQSRDWMNSIEAKFRHATKGTWFSDEQRKQIVDTMKQLGAAKAGAEQPQGNAGGNNQQGGGYWDQYPKH